MKLLLDNGSLTSARCVKGMTALHYALRFHQTNLGVIRLLLTRGADRNAKTKKNLSPLDLVEMSTDELKDFLSKDFNGNTAITELEFLEACENDEPEK